MTTKAPKIKKPDITETQVVEAKRQVANETAIQNLNRDVQSIQEKLRQMSVQYDRQLSQMEKQAVAVHSAIDKLQHESANLQNRLNDQWNYSKGFYDGRRYIVSRAEQILCEQTGCRSREELAASGKIPPFWTSTLVLCLDDPPRVLNLAKKEERNGN